ncbi:MAG: hypothetical protein K6E86_06965 [Bacteroidales bacterium]|nr:hypothetical protein [Bacteroidales bacterium]
METSTLNFDYNAKLVYLVTRNLFERKRTRFSSVKFNDELYIIEARRGAWLTPFSEQVKIKVVATSTDTSKVVLESSSRSWLNLLNFGANSTNISDLSDYINNEVFKMHRVVEVSDDSMDDAEQDHSAIRIVKPRIRFK